MIDYTDDIRVMTQEDHDDLSEGGCDPHCHACGREIAVGDQWAFKLFVKAGSVVTPEGLVHDVRGTCCASCVENGVDLSTAERERLEARLRGVRSGRPAAQRAERGELKKDMADALGTPKEKRHGCFVLPDGTRF